MGYDLVGLEGCFIRDEREGITLEGENVRNRASEKEINKAQSLQDNVLRTNGWWLSYSKASLERINDNAKPLPVYHTEIWSFSGTWHYTFFSFPKWPPRLCGSQHSKYNLTPILTIRSYLRKRSISVANTKHVE
jgi:hypothetical protein